MTLTESPPAQELGADSQEPQRPTGAGLADLLSTNDHKAIGRLFIVFGLIGTVFGVVLAGLVALENVDSSGLDIFSFGGGNQTFFQAWSMGQTAMLFLGILPLFLGIALYVVPLQVGASSISFPRAAAASFWTWLVAGGMHVATIAIDGGLGNPESAANAIRGTERDAVELAMVSLGVTVLALILAALCVVTTIITQRPQGMSLYEVPMFSWSMLVAGSLWLLTLPVLLSNLVLAGVDFRGEDAVRYGDVRIIWDQLDWVFSQPQVFALAVPVLGIVAEIVAVSSGRPQRGRWGFMVAIGALGVLSFGAWSQRYFSPDLEGSALYVVVGLLLVIPIVVVFGGLLDTLVRGRPRLHTHLVLALLAMLGLLAASIIAVVRVLGQALGVGREYDEEFLSDLINPLEDLQGTTAATALSHQLMFAVLIGLAAGLYYWGPKIFGRQLSSGAGILGGLSIVAGGLAYSLAMLLMGFLEVPERVFGSGAFDGLDDLSLIEGLSGVALAGAALVVLGLVIVLGDVLVAAIAGRKDHTAADPWNGHTLEWATSSPPPPGNFAAAPEVRSPAPLYEAEETS